MNAKSNQKNLGVIKSSNLCMEITEFSAPDEIAVCNLASVCLPRFVKVESREFDFVELHRVVKVATRNLNCIIDRNFYPLEKARKSNLRHRPIGVGVQVCGGGVTPTSPDQGSAPPGPPSLDFHVSYPISTFIN